MQRIEWGAPRGAPFGVVGIGRGPTPTAAWTPPAEVGSETIGCRYRSGVIEIGLTGGIGSGKSTVAAGFVDRGGVLIDADHVVRELQVPGAPVFVEMVARFGDGIVGADGSLDRAAVARVVFADAESLAALNAIVHPATLVEIERRRASHRDSGAIVVLDIPLLVVPGQPRRPEFADLAGVVVVDVPEELQVQRLVEGRGFGPEDARARMAKQASREQRLAEAQFVIDNSGDRDQLEREIEHCWTWINSLDGPTSP